MQHNTKWEKYETEAGPWWSDWGKDGASLESLLKYEHNYFIIHKQHKKQLRTLQTESESKGLQLQPCWDSAMLHRRNRFELGKLLIHWLIRVETEQKVHRNLPRDLFDIGENYSGKQF